MTEETKDVNEKCNEETKDANEKCNEDELCEHGSGDSESCELCEDQRWLDAALGAL